VAIGNISDWKKINAPTPKERVPDWRQFEKLSTAERELAAERQWESQCRAAYEDYVGFVENDQVRVPPRYKVSPLSYAEWSKHLPKDVTDISLASQIATNAALLTMTSQNEVAQAEQQREEDRQAVLAGKPDPGWKIPASGSGQNMSVAEEKAFVREQAQSFCDANPDFLPSKTNFNSILAYLWTQGVSIPTQQCLELAHKRLRELGLIEERPAVEPEEEPTSIEEPPSETPGDYEVSGFDPETGEPRKFTQREIWRMDSATYRKAFKAWGENKPRFTRGYYA
jgi:hypothetical protein